MSYKIIQGDNLASMREMPDNSVDSIVTDPPYGLSFMGKKWDYDVPSVETWRECFRVLKPGGHLLAFGGSRTYHRLVIPIEDAGFEIRDQIMWLYGSGFPKSHNVSKAIDKAAGAEREVVGKYARPDGTNRDYTDWKINSGEWKEGSGFDPSAREITAPATEAAKQWDGWGTALKPAHEPIVMARKPLKGTVAANVLEYGTGAINIDGCRIGEAGGGTRCTNRDENGVCRGHGNAGRSTSGETVHGPDTSAGRWPANILYDGSEEVTALFPETSAGSAARYFYCAKASKRDRDEGLEAGSLGYVERENGFSSKISGSKNPRKNSHPTVKPTQLMRYLCRLVTTPSGVVLDLFCGSGSTGKAAILEGFQFVGLELDPDYVEIAEARCAWAKAERAKLKEKAK